MHDIFISYSSKDKTAAYAVCHALEADRIRCWIAPRDILPGDDWGRSIQEAISAGKGVVLILSKNSLASRQVQAEVILAVQETRFVVPIRIEEVSPTGALQLQLAGMHWLDAFPPPLDQHLKSLAETIRGLSTGQTRGGAAEIDRSVPDPGEPIETTPQGSRGAAAMAPAGQRTKFTKSRVALIAACAMSLLCVVTFLIRSHSPPAIPTTATQLHRDVPPAPASPASLPTAPAKESAWVLESTPPVSPSIVTAPAQHPHSVNASTKDAWAKSLKPRLGAKAFFDAHINTSFISDWSLPLSKPLGVAGIRADGTMVWSVASAWIKALNACKYLGYADWRLPRMIPLNEADLKLPDPGDPDSAHDGTSDIGFNVGAPGTPYYGRAKSELPHLFYFELGNHAAKDIHGVKRKVADSSGGPFTNLKQGYYWTETSYGGGDGRFAFDFDSGAQYAFVQEFYYRAVAVRTGDSAIQGPADSGDHCR